MTRSLRISSALVVAALTGLTAGCTTNFRPVMATRTVSPRLAVADLTLESGTEYLGEATVWLDSVRERTLILGVRLRNEGESPLRLDRYDTQLELRTGDGRIFVLDQLELTGDPAVGPGQTGRSFLVATLPDELELDELEGFELVWAVVADDGQRATGATLFKHETWSESQYY